MKIILIAFLSLVMAFKSRQPGQGVLLGCYNTSYQRDQKLGQALTAIMSGPAPLIGYETFEHDGAYCYKVYMILE